MGGFGFLGGEGGFLYTTMGGGGGFLGGRGDSFIPPWGGGWFPWGEGGIPPLEKEGVPFRGGGGALLNHHIEGNFDDVTL